jgi:hypothetical protein
MMLQINTYNYQIFSSFFIIGSIILMNNESNYNYDMIGGGKPNVNVLKDINLFPFGSDIEKHLNPIYGFLWNETNILKYCYRFGRRYNKDLKMPLSRLVAGAFNDIVGILQPTKKLYSNPPGYTRDLGKFMGYMYLFKTKIMPLYSVINNIRMQIQRTTQRLKSGDLNINVEIFDNYQDIVDGLVDIVEIKRPTVENIGKIKILSESIMVIVDDADRKQTAINDLAIGMKKLLESYKKYFNNYITHYVNFKKNIDKAIRENIMKAWSIQNKGIDRFDIDFFHVVSAVIWWMSSTKEGIWNYYNGLNDVFKTFDSENKYGFFVNVKPKQEFVGEIYTNEELNVDNMPEYITDMNYAMALTYNDLNKSGITIQTQDYTRPACNPKVNKFADCGVTTIRNFVKVLMTDFDKGNEYDYTILEKLGTNGKVLNFF